jgi:tetratricopeptide (TPR) repeat protein
MNDQEIRLASGMIQREEFAGAAGLLEQYVAEKPDSSEGWGLLCLTYERKGDRPAYLQAITRLCELHLASGENNAAWDAFEQFAKAGGDALPPETWLELCNIAEDRSDFERALREYEKMAEKFTGERASIKAQVGAARICLKRLGRPLDALRYYEAAADSSVPHVDLETTIKSGIRDAKQAIGKAATAGD